MNLINKPQLDSGNKDFSEKVISKIKSNLDSPPMKMELSGHTYSDSKTSPFNSDNFYGPINPPTSIPGGFDFGGKIDKMDLDYNKLNEIAGAMVKDPKLIRRLAKLIQEQVEITKDEELPDDAYKAIIANYVGIEKDDIDKKLLIDL